MRLAVIAVAAALGLAGSAASARDVSGVPAIAFFGFQLINTSLEPTTAVEDQRIRMLDDLFREKLSASGRFTIAAISPDVQHDVASGPTISNCNGCERDYVKRTSANWAAWGTVQKVSNLNSQYQRLYGRRADREARIRQKRRYPRKHR